VLVWLFAWRAVVSIPSTSTSPAAVKGKLNG
jgi:hypothetical protein